MPVGRPGMTVDCPRFRGCCGPLRVRTPIGQARSDAISFTLREVEELYIYLKTVASSPQISFDRFIARIGMKMVSPLPTLINQTNIISTMIGQNILHIPNSMLSPAVLIDKRCIQ